MCMSVFVNVYLCIKHAGACRGQEKVSGFLEPELRMVVSRHVSAGVRTQALCKSSQCS